jgi:hypothetical protein
VADDEPADANLLRDPGDGEPVEAVPANAPLFAPAAGDGVRSGLVPERRVERGVEDGDVRHAGQRALRVLDRGEGGPVVQRRERGEVRDRGLDPVVDDDGIAKAVAAVDDAMTDGVRRCERLDRRRAVLAVDDRELQARRARVDDEDAV